MKKLSMLVLLTMLFIHPGVSLAHEGHNDGDEMQGMQGMQDMQKMHEENAATLMEAAAALKATHPDLAAKLEQMAQHHHKMAS